MAIANKKHAEQPNPDRHTPFSLVLAGGGARGLSHAGVLFALDHYGYKPSSIVGVSMGAIVGTTYALNPNWYSDLVNLDVRGFPNVPKAYSGNLRSRIRDLIASELILQEMLFGWGVGSRSSAWGKKLLQKLTLGRDLEEADIAIAVVATDLRSGKRVVIEHGNAGDAAYASAALAGIVPPFAYGDFLLADGCYTDLFPIDVARRSGAEIVIAVDPSQSVEPDILSNGLETMLRAMEICQREHALLRLHEADFVIRPEFRQTINTLEFQHKRACIASGIRSAKAAVPMLGELLRRDAA